MLDERVSADFEADHGVGFGSPGGDAYEDAFALFVRSGDDEVQVRRAAEVFFVEEEEGVAGPQSGTPYATSRRSLTWRS
jgi:hypothetical protein